MPAGTGRTWAVVGVSLLVFGGAIAAFLLIGRTATGALVSLTTGKPIAGAVIQSTAGTVMTDDAGRFVLPKLHIGNQDVTVTATGHAPFKTTVKVAVLGGGDSQLKLPDAAVRIHLVEAALQKKTVDGAKVRIGAAEATAAEGGTYEIKGLAAGPATITVTSASHESTKTTVRLKPGTNDVKVSVYLTPAETYSRYFEAYKAGQWAAAYAYLHPDVAKRESLATYTKDMKNWGAPVSIQMQGTRILPTWTSPYTQLTYKDVAEIKRTLLTDKGRVRIQSALPQHWTNVGGLWLRVDL